MKRIAWALGWVVVLAAGCGGGTLGKSGAAGNGGVLDGVANVGGPGFGGAAGRGDPGFGGDGAPPGGIGGPGGFGGGFCPPVQPPVCGPLCGNGVIDTCTMALGAECPPDTEVEECDGAQFGTESCATRGYGSGTLTCSTVCMRDETTCSECAPSARLVACGPAPITFRSVMTFGIAATDNEVGLAQVDFNIDTYTDRLTFARLDSKLALTNAVGLEDTLQPGPLQGTSISATAVAPTSSGWLIAGCAGAEVFVHAVDFTGKKVSRTVVARPDVNDLCVSGTFSIVSQPPPGGTALLMWATYYGGSAAALIATNPLSAGPPTLLTAVSQELSGYPDAAWIGDAFYVAAPITTNNNGVGYPDAISLLRVATNGTTTLVAEILKNESPFAPAFASGAADMRLVYSGIARAGANYAVLWRRLGSGGALLTPAVPVVDDPNFPGRADAVAFGDDTVILVSSFNSTQLAITRLDKDGKVVTPVQDVARAPFYGLSQFEMARRGPEVVVGWLRASGERMMLARVTP